MIDWDALEEVEDAYRGWRDRNYPELSRRYVSGEGENVEAFIIGEAPGADEDMKLRPFVGPAGIVLRDLMLLAALSSTTQNHEENYPNCWLTNVVKFRPPMNRTPSDDMIRSVRNFIRREYYAVGAPRLVIPVGGVALKAVTGNYKMSILRAAGKCHWYSGKKTGKGGPTLAVWPMVHPAFAMRSGKDGKPNEQLQALLEHDWVKLGEWRSKNE